MAKKVQSKQGASENFDFESYRKEVIAGLMVGTPFTGENGLLIPLIADFVQGTLNPDP